MSAVRVPDILLRVSPKMLERYQSLAVAGAGRGRVVPLPYTFSRADASTCATLVDRNGVIRLSAANVPRISCVDLDGDGVRETSTIRLNGSRANGWDRSEEVDHANWAKTGATVSANGLIAPDGTTTGDKLIESALNEFHYFQRNTPTLTNNTRTTVSVFVRKSERSWFQINTIDKAGVGRATWFSDGAIGTKNSGHDAWVVSRHFDAFGAVWYRYAVSFDSASGGAAPLVQFLMALSDGGGSYAGNGDYGMFFWGMMIEVDKPFPSSYIKTTTATVTSATDSLTVPFNFGPMDLTSLVTVARPVWADASGSLGVNPTLFQLGAIPHVRVNGLSTVRQLQSNIDTGGTDQDVVDNIPAGTSLALCTQIRNLTTNGRVKQDIGSGFGTESGIASTVPAFGSQTLSIGSGILQNLDGDLIDLIIARGLYSRQEMLAIP